MRIRFVTYVLIAACALVARVNADETSEEAGDNLPQAAIERFDADNDGNLNAEEREKAREAIRKAQGNRRPLSDRLSTEMRKRFDENSNGELEPQEMDKAREELKKNMADRGAYRERMIKRFDKDNDGQLNGDEQTEMRRFIGQRRGPGGLQPVERKPRLNQSSLIEKFDEDKNGELDPNERQQVLAELRKRRSE